MPIVRQSKKKEREFIARLKSESAALGVTIEAQASELAANQKRKEQVDALLATFSPAKPEPKSKARGSRARAASAPAVEKPPANNPFYGLSLQEASRKQLSIIGKPQSGIEIWEALKVEGFISASERPQSAVHWALTKRQKTHGDVMLVGRGQFGLVEWYTPEQREEITKNLGRMAGRDHKTHSERTKLGMANASRRGVRIGAKRRIDDAMVERLRGYLAQGISVKEACAKESISVASFQLLRYGPRKISDLRPLKGEARRRAIQKAKAKSEKAVPDLLTPRVEGSVVH
jgi:hypothetical protein